ALQLLDGGGGERGAVGPLQVGNVGQVLLQDQGLIVAAGAAAVAPTEDRHPQVALPVEAGHVLDARGLAGAAERKVADANDRDRRALDLLPAAVVPPVPQP